MPYKDPEKQKIAVREAKRRARRRASADRVDSVVAESAAGVQRVLPDPPLKDELLRLLGVQARSGSVRAIELLLRMEAPDVSSQSDPLAGLDELAAKRGAAARA